MGSKSLLGVYSQAGHQEPPDRDMIELWRKTMYAINLLRAINCFGRIFWDKTVLSELGATNHNGAYPTEQSRAQLTQPVSNNASHITDIPNKLVIDISNLISISRCISIEHRGASKPGTAVLN